MADNKARSEQSIVGLLGTPTYETVQDYINTSQSGSLWSGMAISDGGSGTVDIGSGTGMIKSTNSGVGENFSFDFAGTTGLALTDNNTNYVYIDYNAGTPIAAANVSLAAINLRTQLVIGRVYRSGSSVNILQTGQYFEDFQAKACKKDFEVYGFQRASGEVMGETGTRNLTVTAGVDYCAHNRITTPAIDTSGSDTYDVWNSSASTTADTTGVTQVDNANYWNGAAVVALTSNRYGTRFFYRAHDGYIHMQYGISNETSEANALAETVPTPPVFLRDFALYIGRVVIQEGSAVFAEITNPFETPEQGIAVTDHGNLSGLSDDDHLQYALLAGRVTDTSRIAIPSGTTGERPGTPANGDERYNTTTNRFEFYENSVWENYLTETAENLWDRTGTTLIPHTAGDDVRADGGLIIGTGAIGVDYTLTFNGQDSAGILTWDEDNQILNITNDATDAMTTIEAKGSGAGSARMELEFGNDASAYIRTDTNSNNVQTNVGSSITKYTINEDNNDCDVQIWGTGVSQPLMHFDAGNNNIGVGDSTPSASYQWSMTGNFYTGGSAEINAELITNNSHFVNITTVNAATYDLAFGDYILNVTYTGTGAVTSLTLPTAQTTAGRIIHIKDAGGNAGTYTITIDTEGGQNIDGVATYVINIDYDSVSLYCDGTNWFIY